VGNTTTGGRAADERVPGTGFRVPGDDDGTMGDDGAPDHEATPEQDTASVRAHDPAACVQACSPNNPSIARDREVVLAVTRPSSFESIQGGDGI
jgi:hypothetical protein